MLYRLTPPTQLEWNDFPLGTKNFAAAVEHGVDFDGLAWQQTESRVFSSDMLRIALRHGVSSRVGIVLSAMHTTELGRADELKLAQQQLDESQARTRQQTGARGESLMPASATASEKLDAQVRAATEKAAQEAEASLAKELAAPVNPELAEHWVRLGGRLPD